jgi:hypothetical protein
LLFLQQFRPVLRSKYVPSLDVVLSSNDAEEAVKLHLHPFSSPLICSLHFALLCLAYLLF